AVRVELGAQLGRGGERVVLRHDRTEAQHRVERDDVLGAVGQDQGHPVTGAHPGGGEQGRGAVDLVGELAVGGRGAAEVEGDVVRDGGDGAGEEVGDGQLGDREGTWFGHGPHFCSRRHVLAPTPSVTYGAVGSRGGAAHPPTARDACSRRSGRVLAAVSRGRRPRRRHGAPAGADRRGKRTGGREGPGRCRWWFSRALRDTHKSGRPSEVAAPAAASWRRGGDGREGERCRGWEGSGWSRWWFSLTLCDTHISGRPYLTSTARHLTPTGTLLDVDGQGA